MMFSSVAMAQSTGKGADVMFQYVWLAIMILMLFVLLLLVFTLKKVVTILKIEMSGGVYETVEEQSVLEKILSLKPLSAEKEIELDHDFDGIKELDNPIPFWFNLLFGFTIVIAIGYMMVFHVFDSGDLQAKEYDKELVEAEISRQAYIKLAGNLVDENSVKILEDKARIAEGASIFTAKCAVCHGDKGQGSVGPNLTDEYWLHGGDIRDIFKTIKYGVPSKGMVAWQNSMNGAQIEQLANFILTLQGTHPEGAKEPQGEKTSTIAADTSLIHP
jgi:cytochrome c oxidase cbb3-type subunit 3